MTKSIGPVRCPNCAKSVAWSEKQQWKPFCSERCRLIDLGEWFDGKNRIPGEPGLGTEAETQHSTTDEELARDDY